MAFIFKPFIFSSDLVEDSVEVVLDAGNSVTPQCASFVLCTRLVYSLQAIYHGLPMPSFAFPLYVSWVIPPECSLSLPFCCSNSSHVA